MCWYCLHVLFFTCFSTVYRCFAFSSIFRLQNCIQVCSYLKSILRITIFCIVAMPLYLYVFLSRMAFHTFIFHRKESMEISCYIIYFSLKILIFWLFFYFSVLYLSYTFNTGTWWERKMLRGLICSRRNRDVNKQRRVLQFSEFVWP